MQTITPEQMLAVSFELFTSSEEYSQLESGLSISWLQLEQTTETLDTLIQNAAWLENIVTLLSTSDLSNKSLCAELRLGNGDKSFKQTTCDDIQDCLVSAYGIKPSASDIGPAYFAVLVKEKLTSNVISTMLVDFRPFPYNEFHTRMEAVEKKWQRQKVGTELFKMAECAACFLVKFDPFVAFNLSGEDPAKTTISSCVDVDAPEWQRDMMVKLGFEEQESVYEWQGEIEFFKTLG
jgi:hypothetical protein